MSNRGLIARNTKAEVQIKEKGGGVLILVNGKRKCDSSNMPMTGVLHNANSGI